MVRAGLLRAEPSWPFLENVLNTSWFFFLCEKLWFYTKSVQNLFSVQICIKISLFWFNDMFFFVKEVKKLTNEKQLSELFFQDELNQKSHKLSQAKLKKLHLELNPSQMRAKLSSDTSLKTNVAFEIRLESACCN